MYPEDPIFTIFLKLNLSPLFKINILNFSSFILHESFFQLTPLINPVFLQLL